ncbi:MAG: hypothetical protein EBV03_13035, partial [Proteobacteria bacterium]|nr:hypothetical protein [Pseudomonadota bacterium]
SGGEKSSGGERSKSSGGTTTKSSGGEKSSGGAKGFGKCYEPKCRVGECRLTTIEKDHEATCDEYGQLLNKTLFDTESEATTYCEANGDCAVPYCWEPNCVGTLCRGRQLEKAFGQTCEEMAQETGKTLFELQSLAIGHCNSTQMCGSSKSSGGKGKSSGGEATKSSGGTSTKSSGGTATKSSGGSKSKSGGAKDKSSGGSNYLRSCIGVYCLNRTATISQVDPTSQGINTTTCNMPSRGLAINTAAANTLKDQIIAQQAGTDWFTDDGSDCRGGAGRAVRRGAGRAATTGDTDDTVSKPVIRRGAGRAVDTNDDDGFSKGSKGGHGKGDKGANGVNLSKGKGDRN